MKIIPCAMDGVLLLEPEHFTDKRGLFCEIYSSIDFKRAGIDSNFVQDNISRSSSNVLRGLHYQLPPFAQAKLVGAAEGTIFDVAVDLRKNSPTFGKWFGAILDAPFKRMIFIPAGFAHGFCVLGQGATVLYKCDAPYSPEHERGIRWDDPHVGIDWPIKLPVIISEKDGRLPFLSEQKDLFHETR